MFQQRPISSAPMSGLMGILGQQNIGITTPIQPTFNGGIVGVDMDPITPGIQSTPGIVTPIGPPVVVSGPANNTAINSVSSSMDMIGGKLNPIIESNSPFGIINGSPSIIKNQGFVAVNNESILNPTNQFVDNINIINPQGIQPFNTFAIPNIQQTSPVYETPAFQGPIVARKNCFSMCPRWVWIFVSLAILGAVIGGLFACFRPRDEHIEQQLDGSIDYDRNLNQYCKQGQLNVNGKCIRCPQNTIWNGKQCTLNQNYRSFLSDNHPINQPTNITTIRESYHPPISNPTTYSNFQYPNTGNFQRVQTTKSSWNSGNAQGNFADGFSAGSTTRLSKSIGQIKKIIVDPIIEDPIN